MGGIFISYRHDDSGPYAGRLRDTLSNHFGASQVFRDIDQIAPGARFPRVIEVAVGSCDAFLAVIGPQWLSIADAGTGERRLDDPADYVRREIAAALERDDVLVVPVLVGTAQMPAADELPEALAGLAECNAVRLSDDGWSDQVARLIRALDPVVEVERKTPPAPSPASSSPPPAPPPPPAPSSPPRPWTPAWSGGGYAGQAPWAGGTAPRPAPAGADARSFPTGAAVAVVIGVAALAALGFAAVKLVSGFIRDAGPGDPSVTLSTASGPPGTAVTVRGTGFGSDETVDLDFQAAEVGTTRTAADGSFSVVVTIPDTPFRNQQFDIVARGKRTYRFDSAPFTVT